MKTVASILDPKTKGGLKNYDELAKEGQSLSEKMPTGRGRQRKMGQRESFRQTLGATREEGTFSYYKVREESASRKGKGGGTGVVCSRGAV